MISDFRPASPELIQKIGEILVSGLGIIRNAGDLEKALHQLESLKGSNFREENRIYLAKAMLRFSLNIS